MSVYTVLSFEQIQTFVNGYGKNLHSVTPIQNGIENSNWFIHCTDGGQAVLTLFEELNFAQAAQLGSLLDGVAQHRLPVAAPWINQQGERLSLLADKPAQLAPRLQGVHPTHPTTAQCHAMGRGLAQLHVAMQSLDWHKHNAHGQAWWQTTASELRPLMSVADQQLLDRLFAEFAQVQSQVGALPRGLIHGDLFRDNSLFDGERLSGMLDFSECCTDEYLLDIAITLNDFCSDWPDVGLDDHKKNAFLQGYQQIRVLTEAEHTALPIYLAMAAGRFWLSRLQVAERNRIDGRVGEHVLQKDPNEMMEMVRDRLNLK